MKNTDAKDILDAISINIEQISSLNSILYELAEDISNKNLSNKYYALSHSLELILEDTDKKTNEVFKLIANKE